MQFPKLSIKIQVVVGAAVIGSILLFTQTAIQAGSLKDDLMERIKARQIAQTTSVSKMLGDAIEMRLRSLEKTAAGLTLAAGNDGRLFVGNESLLKQGVLPIWFDAFQVFDRNGLPIYRQPGDATSASTMPMSMRHLIRSVQVQGESEIGIVGDSPESTGIVLSVPILDPKGQVSGVLAGRIGLLRGDILGIVNQDLIAGQGEFFIFGPNRMMIFHPDLRQMMRPVGSSEKQAGALDQALGAGVRNAIAEDVRGEKTLYAFSPIQKTDWVLGSSIAESDALVFVTDLQKRMVWTSGFLFCLLIPLLWMATRKALLPLESLSEAMRARADLVSVGGFLEIVREAGSKEIRKASKAFNVFLRAHNQSQASLALSTNVFSSIQEGIIITDADVRIIDVNPAFCAISGYAKEEVLGKNPRFLSSHRHDKLFYQTLWAQLKENKVWRGEILNCRKNGEVFPEQLSITALVNEKGEVVNYVGILTDISEFKSQTSELERIAHYDALTGLPNRKLVSEKIREAIHEVDNDNHVGMVAVAILDVDSFKLVNDNFGLEEGDRILRGIGETLSTLLRKEDCVGRLGGDEFAIVLTHQANRDQVQSAIQRFQDSLRRVDFGHGVRLTVSIGVTVYPFDEQDPDRLLRHADQALYQAKRMGKNVLHFFDPEESRSQELKMQSVTRIAHALKQEEMTLYYQPKVNLITGELLGVEALIRWYCPENGVVSPQYFVPLVENTPLELEMGFWVLNRAIWQLNEWQMEGMPLSISVNISAYQLQSPGFVEELAQLMKRFPSVSPSLLEIEILESSAVEDWDHTAHVVSTCRSLGVRFSIDDFGTGYSSLLQLRRLPVDTLKIDQSFILNMLRDPDDLSMVEGIVHLSETFSKRLIAEGVETQAHAELLIPLGCHMGQGHGIGQPMPANAMASWLDGWKSQGFWKEISCAFVSRELLQLTTVNAAHQHWMSQLEKMIQSRDLKQAPEFNSKHCAFGRWYNGSGKRNFSDFQAYVELDEAHELLHSKGVAIHGLCQRGLFDQAEKVLPSVMTLHRKIVGLIDILKEDVRHLRVIDQDHGTRRAGNVLSVAQSDLPVETDLQRVRNIR